MTHDELLKMDGVKITCTIEGRDITDAEIAVERGEVFVLQNFKDGRHTRDKRGYAYSWIISQEPIEYVHREQCTNIKRKVTDMKEKMEQNIKEMEEKLAQMKETVSKMEEAKSQFVDGVYIGEASVDVRGWKLTDCGKVIQADAIMFHDTISLGSFFKDGETTSLHRDRRRALQICREMGGHEKVPTTGEYTFHYEARMFKVSSKWHNYSFPARRLPVWFSSSKEAEECIKELVKQYGDRLSQIM